MTREEIVNKYRSEFNALGEKMQNELPTRANHVIGRFFVGMCPNLQFIGWEALKDEDLPHNIAENGIYIRFKVDFEAKAVEVFDSGHIYLCREEQKATYLSMIGMKGLLKARGGKWFRKQKFKDINDLYNRMRAFYDATMNVVSEYTNGYPYKEGIGWSDPTMNEKTA